MRNPLNSHSTPRSRHRRMNLTSNVLETRFMQHTKFFNQPWPTTNHSDTAFSGFSTQKSTLEQSMINKIKSTLVLSSLLLLTFAPSLASAAASPDPYADETPAQRDARMKWWREARFGMFIHWGVYSVPAGTYHGTRVPNIGEWIMSTGKIPMAEYQAFAKEYNPVKYNPDDWVRLAKDAGMKYIVITAKHHDGFANFDTRASDWNIVKATPYGKDVLKPLAAACRKYGVKLGFYYSQAQDWNNGGSEMSGKWDKAQEHNMDDYIDKIAVPQMRELLSNYGEFPAVLWWDTPVNMNKERADKLAEVLKLKPGIIF